MPEPHFNFYGLQSTGWFLVSVTAVVVALGLIAALLRYERRLVSRRVGTALLVLRTGVLAVLLLAFLEPTLAWDFDRERRGRILVALDVSGTLVGDLAVREVARIAPTGTNTFVWGVQLHQGSLYAIDMLSGLFQLGTSGF